MEDVNDGLETFDSLMQQGLVASATDQGARAIELFTQAAALAPAAGMPHFLIGAEHAALENFAEAEIAFSDAIALAPAMAIARYQLGLLQFSMVRIEVALRTWKPLLDMPEPNPYRGFIHGFAALAQEDPKAAVFHFREGLAKNVAFQEACEADPHAGVITRMLSEALAGDIERVLAGIAEDAENEAALAASSKKPLGRPKGKSGKSAGRKTHAEAASARAEEDAPTDTASQSDHFLLANYSPQGRPN